MSENTELIEKREELKRQLAVGEYQTLVDVILDGTGRLIQKLTRNPEPISFWFSGVVIALVTLLIGFLTSILLGEFYALRREMILLDILGVGLGLAWIIASKICIDIAFTTWRDNLLDAVKSGEDLADLQYWLATVCNVKKSLFFSLAFGILSTIVFVISGVAGVGGGFSGFGSFVITLIVQFQTGIFIYYFLLLLVILPIRLSRYHFKLFAADPGSSEVIACLSDMLTSFVYITAALVVINTLILAFLTPIDITFLVLGWGILIALFAINQYAPVKIITKAKRQKLNEIQMKIEKLEAERIIADKETMEAINRLMDYHDRIKATRNSALDFRAGLNFLNSLLLPLAAFILANLENVLGLFN